LLDAKGQNFAFWAHTDRKLTGAWCFSELAELMGLGAERFLLTGGDAQDPLLEGGGGLSDQELALLYRSCRFTVAPGLGEGFGYPIVESQACGVPVLGVDYAGGAEWLKRQQGIAQLKPEGFKLEGIYLLSRPVVSSAQWCKGMMEMLAWNPPGLTLPTELAWPELWPRWERWFAEGLGELR
jgi:glycosyltransferase involved in cell wall biosynthesis